MADGPHPCSCQHDKASHFADNKYDYDLSRFVNFTGSCLVRGCECKLFRLPLDKDDD